MWIEVVLCGIIVVMGVVMVNQNDMLKDKDKVIAYLKRRGAKYVATYKEEPMSMNEAEWWEG